MWPADKSIMRSIWPAKLCRFPTPALAEWRAVRFSLRVQCKPIARIKKRSRSFLFKQQHTGKFLSLQQEDAAQKKIERSFLFKKQYTGKFLSLQQEDVAQKKHRNAEVKAKTATE